MNLDRRIVLGGVAALLVLAGVYHLFLSGASVTVAPVTRGPAFESADGVGTVASVIGADINAPVGGRVTAVDVQVGDLVDIGQILLKFDDTEAQAVVKELESSLTFAASEVARLEQESSRIPASRLKLAEAITLRDQVNGRLATAKKLLAEHVVLSPMKGRVLKRDVEAEGTVILGQNLLSLGQDRLRIDVTLPEAALTDVTIGQRAFFVANAMPDQTVEARVLEVAAPEVPGGPSPVRLALPEKTDFKPGMTGRVQLVLRENPAALLVPSAAVVPVADGHVVWVVVDGYLDRRPVRVGGNRDGKTEIRVGLKESERVVVDPSDRLVNGRKARATEAAEGPAG
jgi:membrane fusion protein (multidrug efflux system)